MEHKVFLYADDLLLYISDPTSSLSAALSLFKESGLLSGYKVNPYKSKLFPINKEACALH